MTTKMLIFIKKMKTAALSLALIFLVCRTSAQTGKITIYCNVYAAGFHQDIKIDYLGADKFLPDSIRTTVLVDYTAQYRLRAADDNKIVLLMSADGWKLLTIIKAINLDPQYYILSKEILVDEPTRQKYIENIRSSFKTAN